MLLGRSWGARGPLLSVLKPDFGRFWAFLCACCVRRFSLNALSVPPLGQVQARFGGGLGLLVALGTLLGVLGTFWGACGRSWVLFGHSWNVLGRSWALWGSKWLIFW